MHMKMRLLAALCLHSTLSAWSADVAAAKDETALPQVAIEVKPHQTNEAKVPQDTIRLQDAALNELGSVDLDEEFLNQIEFEFNPVVGALPHKNKLIVLLFEFFMLGCCGADRCYMGGTGCCGCSGTCLGVIKGFTLGGVGIWALIDWWFIVINALNKSQMIDSMGYHAEFGTENVEACFVIAIIMVVLAALKLLMGGQMRSQAYSEGGEQGPFRSFSYRFTNTGGDQDTDDPFGHRWFRNRFDGGSGAGPGTGAVGPRSSGASAVPPEEACAEIHKVAKLMRDKMAEPLDVRKKFIKELMLQYHPDKNQTEDAKEVFQYVNGSKSWFLHDDAASPR